MGIKKHFKGLSIFLLSCMVTMQISEIEVFSKSINTIEGIIANTTVKDLGETVENFEITVEDKVDLAGIKAEDFVIENAIVDHFGNVGEIDVTELKVEGNKITLDVEDFLTIKSNGSMGDELKVTCTSNEALSFTYSDITKIVSPVADKFETKEYNGLTYKLFSPETDKALPIVIWMHGRGDNGLQLRSARNATMFAEDENQAENPCYVFAPQSDESVTAVKWTDNELENIIAVIEQLIEEGKVDPNRVYLTGHSMGGQGAWNLLRKAPDMFAAAITMAPRIISEQKELDDLEALKDLPVWFFHATNDPINLVSGSKDRYNKLLEVGNKNLRYTELSDEEMIEFGAGANTHATNIVMANTPGVMEWLFAQKKNNENKILNITVNATVKDLGETVENFEITVEEDVDLSNIKAQDFVIENAIVDHFGNVGEIDVTDLTVEGNKITLDVEDFLTIKSNGSMGDELKVTCTSNEALSFTYSDITKIVSPVADKFETKEYNGLTYKLFSPETDKALPIVIWMHG
ncbi:prolyl oligopeptidase family serine peptidase, partial [Clostridioides difficile]